MPKLGTLLSNLAVKAGIPADHKGLIDILSKAELSNTEIPDEIGSAIDANLLSLESGKNNPALKAHYFAQALNGIDAETNRIMDEFGFDDETKAEMLAEKSSMKRVKTLAEKIKALEEKKAGAAKKDQPDLTEKIHALQREKADAIKQMEQRISEIQAGHENDLTSLQLKTLFSGKNYAASHLPQEVNITTADILFQKELAAAGAKVIRKNGALALVNANDPTMDYYDKSNNKPSVEQFIDGVLAQNKLLAASNPNAAVGGNGANGQPIINPQGNPAAVPDGPGRYDEVFDRALADFKQGTMPQAIPA